MNGVIIGVIGIVVIGAIVTGVYYSLHPTDDIAPFPEEYTEGIISSPTVLEQDSEPVVPAHGTVSNAEGCSGVARCISGTVTDVIDGDTIRVDAVTIRFALSSTPEISEFRGDDAKDYVTSICPVGSTVLVDEDDLQTEGSHGRIVGVIYCNGINLNEVVLDSGHGSVSKYFCDRSEFGSTAWAVKYGCGSVEPVAAVEAPVVSEPVVEPAAPSCDSSYPTVCIPVYPPDLDCGEISYRNFQVLQPDPHRFDGDKDGIGCES